MMKNKKAQTGTLIGLREVIMGIVVLGAILAIGLFVLTEMESVVNTNGLGEASSSVLVVGKLNTTSAYTILTAEPNTKITSVTSIIPNASFEARFNQTETSFATGIWYLRLKGVLNTTINASKISLYNASTLIGAGNYTIDNVSSNVIRINVTNTTYHGVNLTILYNRTFTTSDDLVGTSLCYITNNCPITTFTGTLNSYGSAYSVILDLDDVESTDVSNFDQYYNVTYAKTIRGNGLSNTTASTAVGQVTTKLATAPTWLGLLIVIIFAMAILAVFYNKY